MQQLYRTVSRPLPAGSVSDTRSYCINHMVNGEGTPIPFGVAVSRKDAGSCELLKAAGIHVGVTVHTHFADNQQLTGVNGIDTDGPANVMVKGAVSVLVEDAVEPGDQAHVRIVAPSGEQIGAFRGSAESTNTIPFPGVFDSSASAGGTAVLKFDCELVEFLKGHVSLT